MVVGRSEDGDGVGWGREKRWQGWGSVVDGDGGRHGVVGWIVDVDEWNGADV